jgi:hypothetical protein
VLPLGAKACVELGRREERRLRGRLGSRRERSDRGVRDGGGRLALAARDEDKEGDGQRGPGARSRRAESHASRFDHPASESTSDDRLTFQQPVETKV